MVVEDYSIGSGQIDAQTTRTSAKQKNEYIRSNKGSLDYRSENMDIIYLVCHSMTMSLRSSSFDEPSKRRYLN